MIIKFEKEMRVCMAKAEYRSAIRSRKRIHDALGNLLIEKSLDQITVTDVVRYAKINRGTFYAHYKDVPDVINHWIKGTFSEIRKVIDVSGISRKDMAHSILMQIQKVLEKDIEFYRKIMHSNSSILIQKQLVQVILDYLLEYGKNVSEELYEDYAFKVRFCAGGLSQLYREWFRGSVSMELNDLTLQAEKLINKIVEN